MKQISYRRFSSAVPGEQSRMRDLNGEGEEKTEELSHCFKFRILFLTHQIGPREDGMRRVGFCHLQRRGKKTPSKVYDCIGGFSPGTENEKKKKESQLDRVERFAGVQSVVAAEHRRLASLHRFRHHKTVPK
ncbi:hypothetical protein TYRP_002331 [Tyrophagus putrescentiae]|nr:hypothetical protein TYRP_002331 [Tyrophagus putrescentiae]